MRYSLLLIASFVLFSCHNSIDYFAGFNVAIDAVTVITFPQSNNGKDWDEDSNPDISFKIRNEEGTIIYSCDSTLKDISNQDLPSMIVIEEVMLPTVDQCYYIELYEIDEENDTIVGKAVSFNPQDLVNRYREKSYVDELPKTERLENNTIKIKVHLSWDNTDYL